MRYTIVLVTLSTLAIIISAQNNEQLTVLSKQSTSCEEQGSCWGAIRESRCKSRNCLKRGVRQDDLGPFWANRGKKDPNYTDARLFVDEPHWILVRRDDGGLYDPFFITRGKKMNEFLSSLRNRRDRVKGEFMDDSPFYAARGKKQI